MEKGTEKMEFVLSCKHLCNPKDFEENQDVLNTLVVTTNKENFKKILMLGGSLKNAKMFLEKCIDYANQTPLTVSELIDLTPRLCGTFNLLKEHQPQTVFLDKKEQIVEQLEFYIDKIKKSDFIEFQNTVENENGVMEINLNFRFL